MKTTVLDNSDQCPCYNETHSPFAVYENEQLIRTACNPQSTHTPSICKEIDKLILISINKYVVVTSALLEKAIQNMGVVVTQKDIQKRLRILSDGEYLNAFRFQSPTARSSNLVYMVGWRGAGFLKANKIKSLGGLYLKDLNPTQTKQLLSASQFLIKTEIDIEHFTMRELVMVPEAADEGKIFRSQAIVRQSGETILVESVRRSHDWKASLLDKLQRINSVITAKEELNVPICKKNVSLLLVAEDNMHMQQVMRIVEKRFRFLSVPVNFTSDSLTYSQPDTCIFSLARKPGFFASLFTV